MDDIEQQPFDITEGLEAVADFEQEFLRFRSQMARRYKAGEVPLRIVNQDIAQAIQYLRDQLYNTANIDADWRAE